MHWCNGVSPASFMPLIFTPFLSNRLISARSLLFTASWNSFWICLSWHEDDAASTFGLELCILPCSCNLCVSRLPQLSYLFIDGNVLTSASTLASIWRGNSMAWFEGQNGAILRPLNVCRNPVTIAVKFHGWNPWSFNSDTQLAPKRFVVAVNHGPKSRCHFRMLVYKGYNKWLFGW